MYQLLSANFLFYQYVRVLSRLKRRTQITLFIKTETDRAKMAPLVA